MVVQVDECLEEFPMHSGRQVLVKFDPNSAQTVDLQGILGLQLKHHSIHLFNILFYLNNSNIIIKWSTASLKGGNRSF
jgi:hypothetical protein